MGAAETLSQSSAHPTQTQSASTGVRWVLPPGFEYPNGIAATIDGGAYVGSITSGRIVKLDADGRAVEFFPGHPEVFASTALRLDAARGVLWGTSPDFTRVIDRSITDVRPNRIFAIDVTSGRLLFSQPVPNEGFGNDLILLSDGSVLMTDSRAPCIWRVSLPEGAIEEWARHPDLAGSPLGLAGIAMLDGRTAIVGGFSSGDLWRVRQSGDGNTEVTRIALPRGVANPDGLWLMSEKELLLIEGNLGEGNGRLLRLRGDLAAAKVDTIEVIASDLDSPVNLSREGSRVFVTLSSVRHLLSEATRMAKPTRFELLVLELTAD